MAVFRGVAEGTLGDPKQLWWHLLWFLLVGVQALHGSRTLAEGACPVAAGALVAVLAALAKRTGAGLHLGMLAQR